MHKLSTWQIFSVLFVSCTALFAISVVFAWVGPTQPPPGGNVAAPINVGTINQVKNGGIGVNALAVFGNTILANPGSATYLNFSGTSGSGGMGIRNNNGTMEYKNSGGAWTPFSSGGSGTSGTDGTTGPTGPQGPSNTQVFTYDTPGTYTWTKPATASTAQVQCWGGGGGGTGGYAEGTIVGHGVGSGGGGGGYITRTIPLSQLPATVTVTIGTGGTTGAQSRGIAESATAGGSSSFGTYAVAFGGGGSSASGFWSRSTWLLRTAPGSGGGYSGGSGETGGAGGTGYRIMDGEEVIVAGGNTSCAGGGGGGGGLTAAVAAGSGGTSGCGGSGGKGGTGAGSSGSPGLPFGGGGGGGGTHFNSSSNGGAGVGGKCVITTS
ncbi:hypothetical protein A2853_01430 [Candidatus Kaiserbacteria bacterium RIFCSPHIGHO2_01_FULL_55_17]|uniref:Glycine-rich domain-containing protein n=1 Tax=Candidatus Kaiserbacteria bacterium RIFCSPHIGHO2_01_FULL_55_17 TaxID=1798484 RepID=A0A1F6D9P1_9BACT|nr:MAG: hypothetical protein A2853_01430 [Candidatus Kaiserbacteria bacterium RIFCSPHIGHO2_01_FULL_55_17]